MTLPLCCASPVCTLIKFTSLPEPVDNENDPPTPEVDDPEEKLWFVVNKYPKEAYKTKGFKLEKNSIIRMGRIRLRVRDIDYPEPKIEKVPENFNKSNRS